MNRKNYKVSTELPELPDLDGDDSILSLFDQTNPDINMFNLVDDEMIRLAGSKMYFYKYYQTEDFDPVYMEARDKPVAKGGDHPSERIFIHMRDCGLGLS